MIKTITLVADAITLLTSANSDVDLYQYTIQAGGNFGSGTLTFLISLDCGTTKNALKDATGNTYSTTTADTFTGSISSRLNTGDDKPAIYAQLAGSTSPSLKIVLVDNR